MGEIWGAGDHVQCVHPLAGCIAGREEVTHVSVHGILPNSYTLLNKSALRDSYMPPAQHLYMHVMSCKCR